MLLTIAHLHIAVAAALRAQTPAVFAAEHLQRGSQQNLLPQRIFQQKTFTVVIANFGVGLADRHFIGDAIDTEWPIEQVEPSFQVMTDRVEAASTIRLYVAPQAAQQADVFDVVPMAAVLYYQLRATVSMQRPHLAQVETELDGSRLKVFIELQLAEFQFRNTNQHTSTGLEPADTRPNSPRVR